MEPVSSGLPLRRPSVPTDAAERQTAVRLYLTRFYNVTVEMEKFIDQENVDDFLQLADQRQLLAEAIADMADTGYRDDPYCRATIEDVAPIDERIRHKAQIVLNKGRQRQAGVRAYNPFDNNPLGHILNVKR